MFMVNSYKKRSHPFRSYHLRNLSLYHCCNAWSIVHRGYPVLDFEFFTQDGWIGFQDLDNTHVLRPKPRLNDHSKKDIFSYIQLSLFDDLFN